MIFLRATKTLGVDTTAIIESSFVPSSSWRARRFAVSSEYYRTNKLFVSSARLSLGQNQNQKPDSSLVCLVSNVKEQNDNSTESPYPELRLIPVFRKSMNRQLTTTSGVRLIRSIHSLPLPPLTFIRIRPRPKFLKLLRLRVALGVELGERCQRIR